MENQICFISPKSINRLKAQGFTGLSDNELGQHRTGIRFAYQLCVSIFIISLLFKSIPLLSVLLLIALIATFHNRHPFDYIYNYGLRHYLNRPALPKRAIQGNIACGIDSIMIALVIYFLYHGNLVGAYSAGAVLSFSAILVSTTDICIPSIIYKAIVNK